MPPHVCEIVPGQMAKKKLDSLQTTDMIDYARRKPEDTRKSINAKAFDVLGLTGNRILVSLLSLVTLLNIGTSRLILIGILRHIY